MPLVLPRHEISLNEPGRVFHRHHHLAGYAALLLDGSCEEVGDCGRYRLRPGDVLLHHPFEAHQDRIGAAGARFINFVLPEAPSATFGRVVDLDAIIRAYERDFREAAALLPNQLRAYPAPPEDWPDLLARRLGRSTQMRLDEWAYRYGLNPASLSRGFSKAYGCHPQALPFRAIGEPSRALHTQLERTPERGRQRVRLLRSGPYDACIPVAVRRHSPNAAIAELSPFKTAAAGFA